MTQVATRPLLRGELANNILAAGEDLFKGGVGNHLQPGVVTYDNEDGTKTTYLLDLDAIARMRPSAAGKPVVGKTGGFDHMKVQPGKKYDGQIAASFWAGDLGWERVQFMLTDKATADACRKGYQFSCAYIPTETDGTPGKWHNVDYDEKILNGEYTHFAVVPNPRYEGATIELFNSNGGGIMNKVLKAALSLVPMKDLREVFNSLEEDEKKKAEADKQAKDNAKTERRAALQSAYDSSMKNASSDEDRAKAKEAFEKGNAELDVNPDAAAGGEAGKTDLPPKPLGGGDVTPEPGVPGQQRAKQNAADDEAAKKAKEKEEKEALEKKNAEDAAAKKEAEEKAKKADDEKKNALELKNKAEKEAKIAAERRERFNALRKLAQERGGSSGTPFVGVVTVQEKEDLGRERYGSRQA